MKEVSTHPLASFHYCPQCGGRFNIHNAKACRCESCGFVYYFNPSAATVAIIINENNELLVCRRAKEPAKGTLDLPGGFCDMYESAEEGVAREVLEETGCEVTQTQYLFSIPNTYLYSGFLVHTIDSFFRCTLRQHGTIEAHDDVAECIWIPLHELDVNQFGLHSIRRGIAKLKELY
ncbi:MAG: NUDIX domain-containing protein [Bacteroidaceae bacterium]|nr:NUDIX domain-containing protein [Bacteroidaceae bacterium]MBO7267590.1 NUDIX domain-containing protein [Bacteroidaceae bacterium]